jgi:hypothetical protein
VTAQIVLELIEQDCDRLSAQRALAKRGRH